MPEGLYLSIFWAGDETSNFDRAQFRTFRPGAHDALARAQIDFPARYRMIPF
jgi:hypothetical protein